MRKGVTLGSPGDVSSIGNVPVVASGTSIGPTFDISIIEYTQNTQSKRPRLIFRLLNSISRVSVVLLPA